VKAVRGGQYSLTTIANALGLSVSRVSRIVSMGEEQATGKACPHSLCNKGAENVLVNAAG